MEKTDINELIEGSQKGELEAYEELMQSFEPLMKKMAHKFRIPYTDFEDLLQEARYVLCVTVQQFSLERNTSFASYYQRSLRNYLCTYLQHALCSKYIPANMITYYGEAEYEQNNIQQLYTKDVAADDKVILEEELGDYIDGLTASEKEVLYAYLKGSLEMDTDKRIIYNKCRKKLKMVFTQKN